MRILKFTLVAVVFLVLTNQSTFAVRAYPQPINITQPDGTELTIRLQGDEFNKYRTTEDGFLILQDSKGYYTYASVATDGTFKQSDIIARNTAKRTTIELNYLKMISKPEQIVSFKTTTQSQSRVKIAVANPIQKAFPKTGSPKSLVILVNFSDNIFSVTTPQTAYTNLLNEVGYSTNGGTGSARDYFISASYGKFSPEFVVVGPVTLPNTINYYGANGTDNFDVKPEEMVIDACTAADAAGLDFTSFDTDNDGIIDNVFIYFAGYNEAEGAAANTIWPHRWDIASSGYTGNKVFDGKTINDYACTSELRGKTGTNMCGIGTFSHEFGHVIGLPDYYHTTANKKTLEYWSIMDYGAYTNLGRTPPTYSVYDRFFLGWLTPQEIKTSSTQTLLPIYQGATQPSNTNQQAYILSASTHNLNGAGPNPSEFYMLEYRKKTGWDTYLPGEGLLIWHIDYNTTAWNSNTPNNYTGTTQTLSSHMRVYLQPLVGSETTPGAAFTTGNFTPTTWAGSDINRAIYSIDKSDNSITFRLMDPIISSTGTLATFNTNIGIPSASQSIVVNAINLTNDLVISLLEQDNYELKLSTQSTWAKTLTIAPTNGNVSATLQIRLNPTTAGAKATQIEIGTGNLVGSYHVSLIGNAIDPNAPALQIGKIESALQYTATKINRTRTKTINIKTTDLVGDLSLIVTGSDESMFTVSSSSITKDAANTLTGSNINIMYKPTSIGTHSATLTVSGGGLNPEKVITLSGTGF